MVKIIDFSSDMPCDLSNQTTLPALTPEHQFELFSSKHMKLELVQPEVVFTALLGVSINIYIIQIQQLK